MNLQTISTEINHLLRLVQEWEKSGDMPEIEREIALNMLKNIYSSIKNADLLDIEISENLANEQAPFGVDSKSLQGVFYDIPDEKVKEKKPSASTGTYDIEELIIPEFPQITGRTKEEKKEEKRLSAEEAAPILNAISNLAGSINNSAQPEVKPTVEPHKKPEAAPAPQPQVTQPEAPKAESKTLSDTISNKKQLLNESIVGNNGGDLASKLQQKPIADLRKAISFNDKFQMIKELFNGDAALYEKSITALNEQPSLDEALIFIHQNFSWDTSSETANHLIELLQRKFN